MEEILVNEADRPSFPVDPVPGREILRVPAVWDARSVDMPHCEQYVPGHSVHWIQAQRSLRDDCSPWLEGRVREVHEDGVFLLDVDDELFRLWNHNPALVYARLRDNGGYARWRPRWGLLTTPSPGGNYLFCVDLDMGGRTMTGTSGARVCLTRPPSTSVGYL